MAVLLLCTRYFFVRRLYVRCHAIAYPHRKHSITGYGRAYHLHLLMEHLELVVPCCRQHSISLALRGWQEKCDTLSGTENIYYATSGSASTCA
jgi:hypothetical protein